MKYKFNFVLKYFYLTLLSFLWFPHYSVSSSIENDSLSNIKRGGVCFRYDDNSSPLIYLRLAEIFNKYDAKFTLSLNFADFWSDDYADSIRIIQKMGHEIMDHTPNHRTNYIKTHFPIPDYLTSVDRDVVPGIDHIIGNKLCLEFAEVDITNSEGKGVAKISNNIVTGGTGDFREITSDDIYLYFPEISKLVVIEELLSVDSIKIKDIWEEEIDLGEYSSMQYFFFNKFNIHLTTNAIRILANESIKLADKYNLTRPKVWIQPGGDFPQLGKEELKEAIGENLNYIAGAASKKEKQVYNEYDPMEDQKFEMQWGDFFEDYWTFEECKNTIANKVAKHYLQIGHTHFFDLPDGLDAYFVKIDSLLAWCTQNDIPIRTYSEWSKILYEYENDPYENIFPPLNVDLDHNVSELDSNGVPDGYVERYWQGQGKWEVDEAAPSPGNYCYTINDTFRICRINNLAGIEKGDNNFEIWTKGELGDSIEVTISYNKFSKLENEIFKFPADTQNWTKYNLTQSTNGNTELIIPDTESLISIDIYCSDYISGSVKISGMSLAKNKLTSVIEESDYIPNLFNLDQNYPNPFNPLTKISYNLSKQVDVTLKVCNVLGSEIIILVDENQYAGNYEIEFDASSLSSGIYFYSLSAGNSLETKKMILIK